MKKIVKIAVVVASVLAVLALTGCGGDDKKKKEEPPKPPTVTTEKKEEPSKPEEPAPVGEPIDFPDVQETDWYAGAVDYVSARGIMKGLLFSYIVAEVLVIVKGTSGVTR